jgi:ribosomal protein S18 acetylase RimI-like enzyme
LPDQPYLQDLERYYDAVPRLRCRTEVFGPLTLFIQDDGGFPFYARPTLGSQEPLTVGHVEAVRARQRELRIPESFEWVAETTPRLKAVIEKSGLRIAECPLLVLTDAPTVGPSPVVSILDADSPALPSAIAAQRLAFSGSTVVDLADEIAKVTAEGAHLRAQSRLRAGTTIFAAAIDRGLAVSAGQHNPVGGVTEIVGVGTLPIARRRGLGTAVTATLVADARARGVETIFLSAADARVARIYEGLGFRRVGTAMIVD